MAMQQERSRACVRARAVEVCVGATAAP